jgi:hypothetical protein
MRTKSWATALIAMRAVNQRPRGTPRVRGLTGKSVFVAFASTVIVELLAAYFAFERCNQQRNLQPLVLS